VNASHRDRLIARYQPEGGIIVTGYKDWDTLWTTQHHIEAWRIASGDSNATAEAKRVTLQYVLNDRLALYSENG
jgi:hypothetical protein